MPTIIAGAYGFVESEESNRRIGALLRAFLADPAIAIRPVDTSLFIWEQASKAASEEMAVDAETRHETFRLLTENGAVVKAETCLPGETDDPVIGVLMTAMLDDGTILSLWNAMECPEMTGKTVTFCLGVAMIWRGVRACCSVLTDPYPIAVSQEKIEAAIRSKISSVQGFFNPFVTHPECFIEDHARLRRSMEESLFQSVNSLLIETFMELEIIPEVVPGNFPEVRMA